MIGFVIDLIACGAAATSILYAHISGVHSQRSGQNAKDSATFARRDAERTAADPGPLEVDRGKVVLRLVHPEEAREQLLGGALLRHHAGKRRNSPNSSPQAEETVPPVQADALPAPGRTPKP